MSERDKTDYVALAGNVLRKEANSRLTISGARTATGVIAHGIQHGMRMVTPDWNGRLTAVSEETAAAVLLRLLDTLSVEQFAVMSESHRKHHEQEASKPHAIKRAEADIVQSDAYYRQLHGFEP